MIGNELPGRDVTQYSEDTLSLVRIEHSFASTDGMSLDIFLAGCTRNPHCPKCYAPALWDRATGTEMDPREIINKVLEASPTSEACLASLEHPQEKVAIMGGEPLSCKHSALIALLKGLKQEGKEVWLYTGNDIGDISKDILEYCDYVKCGPYRFDLPWDMKDQTRDYPLLASTNQYFCMKNLVGNWIRVKEFKTGGGK